MSDQRKNQNGVFEDIGAAGHFGDEKGTGRGTDFDGWVGAGAGIDVSDNFHDVGRTDSVGAMSLDIGRTGNNGGVIRLDGRTPTPNQPAPSEYKTGVADDRQDRHAYQ